MLYLRTTLVVALLSLGATSVAQAQQPQGAPHGARRMAPMAMVDRWLEGITLTAEQTATVDSVKKKYAPQMQALRSEMRAAMQSGAGDRDAMQQKSDALNDQIAGEIRAALAAEQQPTFDSNREAAAAARAGMMRRGARGPAGLR